MEKFAVVDLYLAAERKPFSMKTLLHCISCREQTDELTDSVCVSGMACDVLRACVIALKCLSYETYVTVVTHLSSVKSHKFYIQGFSKVIVRLLSTRLRRAEPGKGPTLDPAHVASTQ
jgi:hypothetical protein